MKDRFIATVRDWAGRPVHDTQDQAVAHGARIIARRGNKSGKVEIWRLVETLDFGEEDL